MHGSSSEPAFASGGSPGRGRLRQVGIAAARAALDHAGVAADEIDLIILATSTPDNTFPATAASVQAGLGITTGAAFDVQAVCSGFVYALTTADAFLRAGTASSALVVGSETFSRILDWSDRATCVLFGDGAGAVVLRARDDTGEGLEQRGIHAAVIRSDGRYKDKLYVDGGPSTTKTVGVLRMEGKDVFRHAAVTISDVMHETLNLVGITGAEIDWFVPHQANARILDGAARKFGIPIERVVITLDLHGNTGGVDPAGTRCCGQGWSIKPGDMVLMEAMGGGFTWGAVLARW